MIVHFFFLMILRPPRSTPLYSSAASDVYKRQIIDFIFLSGRKMGNRQWDSVVINICRIKAMVIYTCLLSTSPAHETSQDLVCRLLLEKQNEATKHPCLHLICHRTSLPTFRDIYITYILRDKC